MSAHTPDFISIATLDPDLDATEFGTQVSNQAHLYQARLPTLDSILITPAFYHSIFDLNQLKLLYHQLEPTLNLLKPESIQSASRRLQSSLLKATIPTTKLQALAKLLNRYQAHSVSIQTHFHYTHPNKHSHLIRPELSFARGDANVFTALRQSLASMFTPASLTLLKQHHLTLASLEPQSLLHFIPKISASGVLFTADPLSFNKDIIRTEALLGLPGPLLDGSLSPQVFVLDKFSGHLLHSQLPQQPYQLSFSHHSLSYQPLKHTTTPILSKTNTSSLVELASKLRSVFYYPQKSLWVLSGNRLYLFSSEPLDTTPTPAKPPSAIHGVPLTSGTPASPGIATGQLNFLSESNHTIKPGSIVAVKHLTPDLFPLLHKAAGLLTETGGLVSHAAILTRELHIPCIVSVTDLPTLKSGLNYTINGSTGEIFPAKPNTPTQRLPRPKQLLPQPTATKCFLLNPKPTTLQSPSLLHFQGTLSHLFDQLWLSSGQHPATIINHPHQHQLFTQTAVSKLQKLSRAFGSRPVIVSLSNLSPHDYHNLKNPLHTEVDLNLSPLGFRGALRHTSLPSHLELELESIFTARSTLSLTNLHLAIPYCHHPRLLQTLKKLLTKHGLIRSPSFKLYLSLDLPANLFQLSEFLSLGIDGFILNLDTLLILSLGFDPQAADPGLDLEPPQALIEFILRRYHQFTSPHHLTNFIASSSPLTDAIINYLVSKTSITPIVTQDLAPATYQAIHQAETALKHQNHNLTKPTYA